MESVDSQRRPLPRVVYSAAIAEAQLKAVQFLKQEKAAKEGRKLGAASADATPPMPSASAAAAPPPGLGGAPGAAVPAAGPTPLGSRAGSGASSVSGTQEVTSKPHARFKAIPGAGVGTQSSQTVGG